MLREEKIYQTKLKLSNSMKELLKTVPFDQIKVTEIVNSCGMNRQTFYYHFNNIFELTKWTISNDLRNINDVYDGQDWKHGLLIVFKYISENRRMCLGLFNSLERRYMRNLFYDDIFSTVESIEKRIKKRIRLELTETEDLFIKQYITISIEALIESWTYEELSISSEEMLDVLERIYTTLAFGVKKKLGM